MSATEGFEEFVAEKTKKRYGLKEAGVALVAVVAFAFDYDKDHLSVWLLIALWGSTYFAYRIGSLLDKRVFDKLYSPNRKPAVGGGLRARLYAIADRLPGAKALMDTSRRNAWQRLGGTGPNYLYATAEKLFVNSDQWDDKVKSDLNWSKGARTFFVLLAGLAVWDAIFRTWAVPQIRLEAAPDLMSLLSWWPVGARADFVSIFGWWPVPLLLCLFAFYVYLLLRVRYMNALYDLVAESNVHRFNVVQTTDPPSPLELISVGSVVTPVDELPLFNPSMARRR